MKKICILGIAITVCLLQPAEAGSRGVSHSFSAAPHFSAPHYSSSGGHYAAPSRASSSGPSRYHAAARFSSAPVYHNRSYATVGPRYSTGSGIRNLAYFSNRARFSGDRTTAFNARTSSRFAGATGAGRTAGTRAQAFNSARERVVARHSANWRRDWDRSRDHWWHGRRCHFHNNVWIIYEPLFAFGYPYGYGYYPYGGYYDGGYYGGGYYEDGYYDHASYDNSYAANEDAPVAVDNVPSASDGDSRVSQVQSALAREGYYDGTVDGHLGTTTRKALRRYQRDHGLEVTGTIDSAVIRALRLR